MIELNLEQVNERAIKKWQTTTNTSTPQIKKEKKLSNNLSRPPQVRDNRPRGNSCTQIIFSKKKGRYIEQRKESPSPKYGYAGGVLEETDIDPEKEKQIKALDRLSETLKASNHKEANTICKCGLKH